MTEIRALSFRGRTIIFLILLSFLSIPGLILWNITQDQLEEASTQIMEVLNPASRMIEQAKSEINLQIQELGLLSSLSPQSRSGAPNFGQLRLSPTLRKLLEMEAGDEVPPSLRPLFKPWAESARSYQARSFRFESTEEALKALRDLREKTEVLHKALDRELSVQLLTLSKSSKNHLLLWSMAILFGLLSMAAFIYFVWAWMKPLELLEKNLSETRPLPPRSIRGTGPFSAPREIQAVVEAFRSFLLKFQSQEVELKNRQEDLSEKERAAGVLFSALAHLTRHNEQLTTELIKKEKLASMGEMAASLAHEIRNPLNSMNLKLELLRDELTLDQQGVLDKILSEIDRLDALTESHLRTTRAHLQGSKELGLSAVVRDTLEMMRLELEKESIGLEWVPPAKEIFVKVPDNILRAALINFIKNSREALHGVKEPKIFVGLRGDEKSWELLILDNGCGFPDEFLRGPIESFKTTKREGSGLGLVTAQKMLGAFFVDLQIFRADPPYSAGLKVFFAEQPLRELEQSL